MTAAAPPPCSHPERVNGLCTTCGDCEHDVILNGACFYCGTEDLDPVKLSPKKLDVIPASRLKRR